MGKWRTLVYILAVLAIGGCSSLSQASTNAESANTALTQAAQTVIAQVTPPALTLTARFTPVPTIAFIFSPTPTDTSVPSVTPTLPPVGPLPVVTVTVYSYCWGGPSEQTAIDAIILPGDGFTPQGVSHDGKWWYVAAPKQHRKQPADHCWIFKGVTSVSGDVSGLPVVVPTIMPTRSPGN